MHGDEIGSIMSIPEVLTKLLYVVVVEDNDGTEEKETPSFRYSRSVLQSTLQLMGCKPRHSFKVSISVLLSIARLLEVIFFPFFPIVCSYLLAL